jgi:hypothetical protein
MVSLEVLFENEDVIAVDKPVGLASIPEQARGKDSLFALLPSRTPAKLYVVHRAPASKEEVTIVAPVPESFQRVLNEF